MAFPVDCTLGQDCYIQQYMDRDEGPGVSDYRCRGLSYDGHKGTDFALPTLKVMHAGVNVLAAADGRVRGFRDGMADRLYSDETAAEIEGRECGNGVVLVHPGAWETQYCHLLNGSIAIKNGQEVKAGDVLGQIGLSGRTEFPHLHLSVRHRGKKVDPFDADGPLTCDAADDLSLWDQTPPYQPGGVILSGFADHLPDFADVKAGGTHAATLPSDAPAVVFYGLIYGNRKGDVLRLVIDGPEGRFASQDTALTRDQAQAYRAMGKEMRRSRPWPSGTYTGTATLLRAGAVVDLRVSTVVIDD